jgi:hypothetical protein
MPAAHKFSLLAFAVLLSASSAFAKVGYSQLSNLVSECDLVVVAKVEKVNHPIIGKRHAKASVVEVWKGAPTASVEFLAEPTWTCDISDAKKGETVVLFLYKEEKSSRYEIMHSGRGRMPQRNIDGKTYADYWTDVRFPEGTPTIDGPDKEQSWIRSIEVSTLKALVKSMEGKKP